MKHSRRVRYGALLVLAMGILALLVPEKAQARTVFHCDNVQPVENCDVIPQPFRTYCDGCSLPVSCGGPPGSYAAYCDHEI